MAADKLCKIDSLYLPLEDYMEEPSGIPLSCQPLHLEKNSCQLAKKLDRGAKKFWVGDRTCLGN